MERTVIFTGALSPEGFAEARQLDARYPRSFDLWWLLDLTGNDEPGFGPNATKTLEECRRLGTPGVDEIVDNSARVRRGGVQNAAAPLAPTARLQAGDPRIDALWAKHGDWVNCREAGT